MIDRLGKLTDKQRQVLRLVARGLQSKEIAQALQVSPHTVDYHARGAIEALGVSNRQQAARLLLTAERGQDYQPLIDQPLIVAEPSIQSASEEGEQQPSPPSLWIRLLTAFTGGTVTNELTNAQRLLRITILVVAMLTAVGLFLLGITAINDAAYRLPV